MNNKLKCQVHNQISIGQVGSTLVCTQCDCSNMIYCQNLRIVEITHLIKSRLKNRGEIRRLQQQKFKINNDQKRLLTQQHFNDQKDIEKMKAEFYKYIIELQQQKILNLHLQHQLLDQIQINARVKINSLDEYSMRLKDQFYSRQISILVNYEEECLSFLEKLLNAEFIIYHIQNRKKWTINYTQHDSSIRLQSVFDQYMGKNFFCQIIGQKTELNQLLEGYYIVFIQSIIYDGLWQNGRLVDGTASYMVSSSEFLSFDASTLMDNQMFTFNNCITFYHSLKDHLRYVRIHEEELRQNQKSYNQQNI